MTIIMFSLFFFFHFGFAFSLVLFRIIFIWYFIGFHLRVCLCACFFAFIFNIFRNSIQKMSLIRLWMEIFYFSFIIAVSFPYFVLLFFPLHNLQCNSIEFSIQTIILPIEMQHKKKLQKTRTNFKHGRLHDILLTMLVYII